MASTPTSPTSPITVAVLDAPDMSSACVRHTYTALLRRPALRPELLSPAALLGRLDIDIDVLVVPGGGHRKALSLLGDAGRRKLRAFLALGGGYVGICGGTYFCKDLGVVGLHITGTNVYTSLCKGVRGAARLERKEPGWGEVFVSPSSPSDDIDATGLWMDDGPLLAPLDPSVGRAVGRMKPLDPLCGVVEPLAVFDCDLLAEERTRMKALQRQMEAQQGAGKDWSCDQCEFLNEGRGGRGGEGGGDRGGGDRGGAAAAVGGGGAGANGNVVDVMFCGMCLKPRRRDYNVPESAWPKAGLMPGAWAIVRSTYGEGNIVLFAPHPELTQGRKGKPQPEDLIASAALAVAPAWTGGGGMGGGEEKGEGGQLVRPVLVRPVLPMFEEGDDEKGGADDGDEGGAGEGGGKEGGGDGASSVVGANEQSGELTELPPGLPPGQLPPDQLELSMRLSSATSGVSEEDAEGSSKIKTGFAADPIGDCGHLGDAVAAFRRSLGLDGRAAPVAEVEEGGDERRWSAPASLRSLFDEDPPVVCPIACSDGSRCGGGGGGGGGSGSSGGEGGKDGEGGSGGGEGDGLPVAARSVCLDCFEVCCIGERSCIGEEGNLVSRHLQGHMKKHGMKRRGAGEDGDCGHAVGCGLADLSFYCYRCNDYLDK
jgi:hypothetical protein